MKNTKTKKLGVPLESLSKGFSKAERMSIEEEKKYYNVIVSLRKKRTELGITQAKLSLLSKIPRTTITKIESGSRNVTIQTLMTMVKAMGKSIEVRIV